MEDLVGDAQFWLDRPTLVTGASGLLGSWLVKYLLGLKSDVVCVVRDWVPHSELFSSGTSKRVKIVRGDIRDQKLLERVLGEHEIKTVFHLAAQTIVPIANRNPISTLESNIQGTWCLLEAARHSAQVSEIVVASSDKAYGSQTDLPYDESFPLQGIYPYDVSKSCADLISKMYAESFSLPVVITRCGNFYGGGDLNWNRLIPGTIRSILRNESPIIRSDGKFLRDYFYVEDGAYAYIKLIEQFAKNKDRLRGQAFNFSYEAPVSVLSIVNNILGLMNSKFEPVILNEANCEIRDQYLSANKARDMLQWSPKFCLEGGLNRTIAWYKDYFEKGKS